MGRADAWNYNLFLILIGVCVVFGAYWVYRLQKDTEEESGVVTNADRLKELERAFYAGELSKEEFEKIKAALATDEPPAEKTGRSKT